jgi:hypothetical protein
MITLAQIALNTLNAVEKEYKFSDLSEHEQSEVLSYIPADDLPDDYLDSFTIGTAYGANNYSTIVWCYNMYWIIPSNFIDPYVLARKQAETLQKLPIFLGYFYLKYIIYYYKDCRNIDCDDYEDLINSANLTANNYKFIYSYIWEYGYNYRGLNREYYRQLYHTFVSMMTNKTTDRRWRIAKNKFYSLLNGR